MHDLIENLLHDPSLRRAISTARSHAETVKLLLEAGAAKGYRWSSGAVANALAELDPSRSRELTEGELLAVSGGLRCTMSGGLPPSHGTAGFGVCL